MKKLTARAMRVRPVRFVVEVVRMYFTKNISRAAAELAYFLILTLFPILICVSAFVARLDLNLASVLEGTGMLLPEGVNAVLEEYLRYLRSSESPALLVVGVFMTVLFASAAVRGLMNIMREIYGRATFKGVGQVGASVLFAFLLLVAIYASVAVVVTGNWFFRKLGALFHLEELAERLISLQWLKYVILLAVMFLIILLLYRCTAPLSRPRPPVMWGALAAAVALSVASTFFAWIMGRSTSYSLVYGSLASVIILLVWLYLCGNILVLGCAVNYVLYQHKLEKGTL